MWMAELGLAAGSWERPQSPVSVPTTYVFSRGPFYCLVFLFVLWVLKQSGAGGTEGVVQLVECLPSLQSPNVLGLNPRTT